MSTEFNPDTVTEFERETWSRCAESYLDTFAELTRQTVPLLVENANISNGDRVPEIGSGPGHVAHSLSQAGGSITGVDFSPQMVSVAQSSYPHITFLEADAEQLPFDAETYDAVVTNFVVHHLARPEVVFKEIYRVLKADGRFVFVVWGSPESQSSMGAFFAAVEEHGSLDDLPHGPLFGVTDHDVYGAMLSAGGLTDCRLETHDVIWRSDTLDPILRGFWDWGKIADLAPALQNKIESTTRENAKAYMRNGHFEFPHTVLIGTATKP
jgi:ubiquinone/menaquinone biosynthesis C-methylase UbiE